MLRPFYPLYVLRTGIYFKTLTAESWATDKTAYLAAQAARADVGRETLSGPATNDWRAINYLLPATLAESCQIEIRAVSGDMKIYDVRVVTPPREDAKGETG